MPLRPKSHPLSTLYRRMRALHPKAAVLDPNGDLHPADLSPIHDWQGVSTFLFAPGMSIDGTAVPVHVHLTLACSNGWCTEFTHHILFYGEARLEDLSVLATALIHTGEGEGIPIESFGISIPMPSGEDGTPVAPDPKIQCHLSALSAIEGAGAPDPEALPLAPLLDKAQSHLAAARGVRARRAHRAPHMTTPAAQRPALS